MHLCVHTDVKGRWRVSCSDSLCLNPLTQGFCLWTWSWAESRAGPSDHPVSFTVLQLQALVASPGFLHGCRGLRLRPTRFCSILSYRATSLSLSLSLDKVSCWTWFLLSRLGWLDLHISFTPALGLQVRATTPAQLLLRWGSHSSSYAYKHFPGGAFSPALPNTVDLPQQLHLPVSPSIVTCPWSHPFLDEYVLAVKSWVPVC